MIILEGCDNTGKTTLKEHILKTFPKTIAGVKLERPPVDRDEYMNFMWDLLGSKPDETKYMVFDRFYFSEVVYGPLLRGKVVFTDSEARGLEALIRYHQPLIIHCKQSVANILATFDEREQLEGVQERVAAICELYEKAFVPFKGGGFIRYDYKSPLAYKRMDQSIENYFSGGYK